MSMMLIAAALAVSACLVVQATTGDSSKTLWQQVLENLKPKLDGAVPTNGKTEPIDSGRPGAPINSHLLNGTLMTREQLPWQALILIYDRRFACGGSLISDLWVLTAAHCVANSSAFIIYMGTNKFGFDVFESGMFGLTSITKVVHPQWNNVTMNNDIALVKLTNILIFPMDHVKAIRLPKKSDASQTFLGVNATIGGWTRNGMYGDISLNSLTRKIIANADCAKVYGTAAIPSSTMCTGGATGVCWDDSGSPLVYKASDGVWTLLGVMSFSATDNCTASTSPVVYTRVSSHLAWIGSTTGIKIV